jgi:hypothetical protein
MDLPVQQVLQVQQDPAVLQELKELKVRQVRQVRQVLREQRVIQVHKVL